MDDPDTEDKAQMQAIRAKLGLGGECRVHSAAANARINRTNQPNHDARIACHGCDDGDLQYGPLVLLQTLPSALSIVQINTRSSNQSIDPPVD